MLYSNKYLLCFFYKEKKSYVNKPKRREFTLYEKISELWNSGTRIHFVKLYRKAKSITLNLSIFFRLIMNRVFQETFAAFDVSYNRMM